MSADVLRRLEAVAARLEAYASSVGTGGAAAGGGAETKAVSAASEGWNEIYGKHFVAFLEAAGKLVPKIAALAEPAFKRTGEVIAASAECKKPTEAELLAFSKEIVAAIEESGKLSNDNRNEFFNHNKAFSEAVQGFGWIMQTMTKQTVTGQLEAADFYLNKILLDGKKKGGDSGEDFKKYALSLKGLMNDMGNYAGTFHKAGIDWNGRGVKLSEYKAGGGAAAPAAKPAGGGPPPPPPPPLIPDAAPAAAAGGVDPAAARGALFAQLSSGGDVTSGLKKVTKDMKSKNQADKPVLVPKAKAADAKKWGDSGAKVAEKKEKKMTLSKTTWFIENYEGPEPLVIPEDQVDQKQNVYILNAKNLTITIPAKVKALQIDGAVKCRIVFKSAVSLCEIFNSNRVKVECLETCPSYAIDKTQGASIEISRAQLLAPPDIISSNISECNLVIPGPTDEADPIELPLPEQYITKLLPNKTLETHNVVHGG